MRNEADLNKLIAEWAISQEHVDAGGIIPDFTHSLDALFKWPVPKTKYPRCIELTEVTKGWVCIVDLLGKPYYADGNSVSFE